MEITIEQRVNDWTRIIHTGELLTLADPESGRQMRVYSAHPHGGYRVLIIITSPDDPLPHVAQARLGPTELHGWLSSDARDGCEEPPL